MEGIWILIFVVVMIFKAFKKITEVKTNLPKDWQDKELPPVFREVPFPWEMTEESEEPEGESFEPMNTTWAEKIEMGKNPPKKAVPESGGKVKQEQSSAGEFLPLMDSNNIVNGIIMSELLQPPKCKRRIPKLY